MGQNPMNILRDNITDNNKHVIFFIFLLLCNKAMFLNGEKGAQAAVMPTYAPY